MALETADAHSLLLHSIGEGIFGIDLEGRCTFVNPAALRMLGHRTESVLGRNMHELMHHSHADGRHYPECDCPIFNAFRRGLPCRIDDEVLWRADGTPFHAEYSSHPVLRAGRHGAGAVVTLRRHRRAQARRGAAAPAPTTNSRRAWPSARASSATRWRGCASWANHAEAVREKERTRIAREIHDELGSLLVALKMDIDWLARRLRRPRRSCSAKCQGMGRLIDTRGRQRRPHHHRPAAEHPRPPGPVGRAGVAGAGVHRSARAAGRPAGARGRRRRAAGGRRWPSPCSASSRRCCPTSRAMRRRAACRSASRSTTRREPVLYLEVRDDGVGAAPQALDDAAQLWRDGHARARRRTSAAASRIDSAPGQGTRVRLVMPLAAKRRPP